MNKNGIPATMLPDISNGPVVELGAANNLDIDPGHVDAPIRDFPFQFSRQCPHKQGKASKAPFCQLQQP